MKKLIAIVISLIFIFEGAGYCLRVPMGGLFRIGICRRLNILLRNRLIEKIALDKDIKYGTLEKAIQRLKEVDRAYSDLQNDIELLIYVLNLPAKDTAYILIELDRSLLKLVTNLHTKRWATDVKLKIFHLTLQSCPGVIERREEIDRSL